MHGLHYILLCYEGVHQKLIFFMKCMLFDTIHYVRTFFSGNMHHVIAFPVEISHCVHSFVMISPSCHTSVLLVILENLAFSGKSVVTPHVSMTEDL